ncbi:MAG: cyclic nucleotide-binding domain-containing protein [candidate division KSB1 bacterium]|nr:cyclic nucleotide-binding domain-containing protein [candidate division KSB1 bacterium]
MEPRVEKVLLLESIDLLSEMTSEQLVLVAEQMTEKHIAKGATIYSEGDVPDAAYILVRGQVVLQRANEDIIAIGPGAAFGAWALVDDSPRSYTAKATEGSKVLRLRREHFMELLSEHAELADAMLRGMARRLRKLVGQ